MNLIKSCDIHHTVYYKVCSECLHELAKAEKDEKKANAKREKQLLKSKLQQSQPKKAISKKPKDWKNTFLCSDGTRVTQAEINERRSAAYEKYDTLLDSGNKCEGCGGIATNHAHIIPQSRCKKIGKTQLIWTLLNFFKSCNACNLAIENSKGKDWRYLKNIDHCLVFIKGHDPELYTKFELAEIDQGKQTI